MRPVRSATRLAAPLAVVSLAVASLAACAPGAPGTPAGDGGAPAAGLTVRSVPGALELVNGDTSAAYFVVLERELSTRALWRPCAVPSDCRSVAPGETRRLPLDSIAGMTPAATHAVVYWYHLVARADGARAHDSVRSVEVPLAAARAGGR